MYCHFSPVVRSYLLWGYTFARAGVGHAFESALGIAKSEMAECEVRKEPGVPNLATVLQEEDEQEEDDRRRGDLEVIGVAENVQVAVIDFSVHDTNAASYVSKPHAALIHSLEQKKITKYGDRCKAAGKAFFPFTVMAEEGGLGKLAQSFTWKLAEKLAIKEKMDIMIARRWLTTRMAFTVIRGSSKCIRSNRTTWPRVSDFYGHGD